MTTEAFAQLADSLRDAPDDELTERLRQLELDRRRIDAELAAITTEADRRSVYAVDGHRSVTGWMRAHLNVSGREAARLRRNGQLSRDHAEVASSLWMGRVGIEQADDLGRLARNPRIADELPDALAMLLDHGEQLAYDQFRTVLTRWESLADADGAQRNDDASHASRSASVRHMPGAAGSGVDVRATGGRGLTAAELEAIFDAFVEEEFQRDVAERTAEHGPDAPASMLPCSDQQRRFDALVRIPVDAFRARMETSRGVVLAPSEVLTAALGGFVRRVVIDSASVPVDAGRKRRLFTGVARDVALALQQSCDHPGCSVAAAHCHADHVDEWERDDGGTNFDNVRPRCRAHNSWKHHQGLWVRYDEHGRVLNMRADGSLMRPVGQPPPMVPIVPEMPAFTLDYSMLRPRNCRCGDRGSSDDASAA